MLLKRRTNHYKFLRTFLLHILISYLIFNVFQFVNILIETLKIMCEYVNCIYTFSD